MSPETARRTIPGIDQAIRLRALELLETKKYFSEFRDLKPYVEAMSDDDVVGLVPDRQHDLATRYPGKGASSREWEAYGNTYTIFIKEEREPWAQRVIDKARKQLETNGPMQRSLMG